MKICIKCNIEKPISEFYIHKNTKDGYRNDCKCCVAKRVRQYEQANKDKLSEYRKQKYLVSKDKIKEYYQKNKAKIADYKRQYQQANKAKIAVRRKQHYQANKDKAKEYNQANKAKKAEYGKIYRKENKQTIAEKSKQYRQTLHGKLIYRAIAHKRRSLKKANTLSGKHFTIKDVKQKLKLQKYKCVYCKASLKKYYEIDHIIALTNGGSNEASNIQLLCKKCNGSGGKGTKDITDFAEKHGMLF